MASEAREKLAQTVDRIFEDGVMDDAEKAELRALFTGGGLTVPEVKEVMAEFVRKTWGEVIEDGIITEEEKQKLEAIVTGLKLPANVLPEAVRDLLAA